MSLYNALFGVNPFAKVLLFVLGTDWSRVPRFRDVYVDGDEIVIYTRTGGGNREHYENRTDGPCNADLRKLPGYLRDEDDTFDSTFAYFRYSVPEHAREAIARITEYTKDRPTPRDAWKMIETPGALDPLFNERMNAVAEHMAEQIIAGKTVIEL